MRRAAVLGIVVVAHTGFAAPEFAPTRAAAAIAQPGPCAPNTAGRLFSLSEVRQFATASVPAYVRLRQQYGVPNVDSTAVVVVSADSVCARAAAAADTAEQHVVANRRVTVYRLGGAAYVVDWLRPVRGHARAALVFDRAWAYKGELGLTNVDQPDARTPAPNLPPPHDMAATRTCRRRLRCIGQRQPARGRTRGGRWRAGMALLTALAAVLSTRVRTAAAQSTGSPVCAGGDEFTQFLQGVLIRRFTSSATPAQEFRAQYELPATSADSIVSVSDSTTCRRALVAVDAYYRRSDPAYTPYDMSTRQVYVFRVGSGFAVFDPDVPLSVIRAIGVHQVIIFDQSFSRTLATFF